METVIIKIGPPRPFATGDPRYAAAKLSMAVYILATGHEILRRRLFRAFPELMIIGKGDFIDPADEERLEWIIHEMTHKEAVGERGRLLTTLDTMNVRRLTKIASAICELADRASERVREQQGGKP